MANDLGKESERECVSKLQVRLNIKCVSGMQQFSYSYGQKKYANVKNEENRLKKVENT